MHRFALQPCGLARPRSWGSTCTTAAVDNFVASRPPSITNWRPSATRTSLAIAAASFHGRGRDLGAAWDVREVAVLAGPTAP